MTKMAATPFFTALRLAMRPSFVVLDVHLGLPKDVKGMASVPNRTKLTTARGYLVRILILVPAGVAVRIAGKKASLRAKKPMRRVNENWCHVHLLDRARSMRKVANRTGKEKELSKMEAPLNYAYAPVRRRRLLAVWSYISICTGSLVAALNLFRIADPDTVLYLIRFDIWLIIPYILVVPCLNTIAVTVALVISWLLWIPISEKPNSTLIHLGVHLILGIGMFVGMVWFQGLYAYVM